MPVMNFDLEDGLPPVSFSLKESDCRRFMQFMAECDRAIKKLSAAPTPPAHGTETAPFTSNTVIYGNPCDTAIKSPAQEDEPVGFITPIYIYREEEAASISRTKKYEWQIPVYTHPANDDLRKAAEEALYCLRLMAEFHFRGKSESAECHRLADNLLDALEGK